MAGTKKETMPDNEAQSDTGEEYIEKVHIRKADVVAKLTCTGCNGFYRGPVTYCQNKHGLCSNCFGDRKKCPITGCAKKAFITMDVLSELVKDLKFLVSCKFKKNGCDQENAEEEVIADHENECSYRKVPCLQNNCSNQPAMKLEDHIFSAHESVFGKCRDNPGKWFFQRFGYGKTFGAQKMWIDSESGLRIWAVLEHNDEKKYWQCYTVIFSGKNVARKFRAEMRLSSYEGDTSHNFNSNVYCLDDWKRPDTSKEFCIIDDQFKIYNKGHIKLGDHNKDKNGELMLPVTVEVKMKKLNVG